MNIGSTTGSSMNNAWSQATQQIADAGQRLAGVNRQPTQEMTERAVEKTGDVAGAVVDLHEGKQLAAAAGKLLETENRTLGVLLDTSA
jgi:hypothetical protein